MVSGAEKLAVERLAIDALLKNPKGEAGDHPIYPEAPTEPYGSRRYRVGEDVPAC